VKKKGGVHFWKSPWERRKRLQGGLIAHGGEITQEEVLTGGESAKITETMGQGKLYVTMERVSREKKIKAVRAPAEPSLGGSPEMKGRIGIGGRLGVPQNQDGANTERGA